MTALKPQQTRYLRGLGHSLKPVVMVGQHGLTDNVLAEVEHALSAHELIKIKIAAADRDEREQFVARIAEHASATPVQRIGHTLLLYRRNKKKPKIVLPKPLR